MQTDNNDRKTTPAVFTFTVNSTSEQLDLHTFIPKQVLTLTNVRFEMAGADAAARAANALAARVAYVEVDQVFGHAQLVDNTNTFNIPILLGDTGVTTYQTNLPLTVVKDIRNPRVRILDANAQPLANFASCTLQFRYNITQI